MAKHAPDGLPALFPAITRRDWRQRVDDALKGGSFEDLLVTQSRDGVAIAPLYTLEDSDPPAADPGAIPYTRGGAVSAVTSRPWELAVTIDHPDPARAHEDLVHDLAGGADAIQLRLDAATRVGRDTDDPVTAALAARDGVAVSTAEQFDALLAGVDLARVALHLDAGANALPVSAWWVTVARRRGVALEALRGTLGFDPFGALARDGRLPGALPSAWRELASLTAWARDEAPGLRTLGVSAAPYVSGGATRVQELAWAVGTGVAYLRALEAAGIAPEDAFAQIAFTFVADRDFFGTVAKLRAARTMWGRVAEACGVTGPEGVMWMQVETAERTLTRRDPWTNALRGTSQAFAAVVGGAQSVVVAPFDGRLGPADVQARRLGINTQHVLRDEAHIRRVVDPAGGSHYVEALTSELAERAWAEMQEMESAGGVGAALTSGRLAVAVHDAAARWRGQLADGSAPVVGVSAFPPTDPAPLSRERPQASAVIDRSEEFLTRHRDTHDQVQAVGSLTSHLDLSARAPEDGRAAASLASAVIEATAHGATLTPLCALLRSGETPASAPPIQPWADDAPFEEAEGGAP